MDVDRLTSRELRHKCLQLVGILEECIRKDCAVQNAPFKR
jgi:hypothetical protein